MKKTVYSFHYVKVCKLTLPKAPTSTKIVISGTNCDPIESETYGEPCNTITILINY